MTGNQHRPSVPDRARRRAIRACAAKLGVSYSVAARLLMGQMPRAGGGARGDFPGGADEHREWLFALRERRSFDLRVRDTRLAAALPLGRAAHLAERFPPLRRPVCLYGGESRRAALGMLYAVLAAESPALLPAADELAWVAELGEEGAVDIVCAVLDRAARLLLDDDRWRLLTRIEAVLVAGEASADRVARDAAITLGREFRAVILRHSLDGARHTLDALLVAAHGGHAPGARVRIRTGPGRGLTAIVVGVRWQRGGPRGTDRPIGYEVRADGGATALTVDAGALAPVDQSSEPESALT